MAVSKENISLRPENAEEALLKVASLAVLLNLSLAIAKYL